MRKYIILIAVLLAVLGSITAVSAIQTERDFQLRGYENPITSYPLPFMQPRLGVNVSLEQYTDLQTLQNQLDLMQSANMVWLRQIIRWDSIETEQGVYDWSSYDPIFETLATYPFKVMTVIQGTPSWYAHPNATISQTAPPDDLIAWRNFVEAFSERYAEQIEVYQIWDEPNLIDNWGGINPTPAMYLALLEDAYTTIKSTDPTAFVLSAALAPTTETGPKNISDWLYLEDLYGLGLAGYVDGIGAKPYGFNSSPLERTVQQDTLNFSRVVRLREIMVENGDAAKGIWASNWGWNTLPNDWQGNPSIWGAVDQQTQITLTQNAIERVHQEWPWMLGMTLYHWQPIAAEDDPIWGFSLVDTEGNPKPLLEALQAYDMSALPTNGLYPPAHPSLAYSGVWTFSELGADVGWLKDSKLSLSFTGDAISLLLRQGDYIAYLYPTINGQPANQLPTDAAGNSYIVLTSATNQPEVNLIPLANQLGEGEHQVNITVDRGWDQWLFMGYAVSNRDLAKPYQQQIIAAWLTLSIAIVALVVTATQIHWANILSPINRLLTSVSRPLRLFYGLIASLLLTLGMFLTWGDGLSHIFRREQLVILASLLTGGMIYLQPGFILTMIALLILFWLIFNDNTLGILLIVVWVPFFLFPVQLYLYAFPIAELLLLLTFTAWLLQRVISISRNKQIHWPTHSLKSMDWLVLSYVAIGVISLSWATYRSPALTELRVFIIEPALFYWIMRTTITNTNTLKSVLITLMLSIILVTTISLGMYLFSLGIITAEGGTRRLAGIYGSPNNMALYLGRMIPFALAFVLMTKDRHLKYLAGIALGLSLITALLTQSAGALLIGLPTAIAVVLILIYQKRAIRILIPLAVIGALGFLVLIQSPRFSRVLDFSSGTNFFRIRVWQSAIEIIQDEPITGLGLDQFLYAFRSKYIMPDAWQEPNLSHPHNIILDMWTRLGLFGVIWLLLNQFNFWKKTWKSYLADTSTTTKIILIGLMGSMANLIAHGMVDNSIFVHDLAIIFMLLLALSVQIEAIEIHDKTHTDG